MSGGTGRAEAGKEDAAAALAWSGWTHPGRFRKNNEDAFLALAFNARESFILGSTGTAPTRESDFVFAVSDGMGGANSGEFASRIAVDRITRLLPMSFSLGAAGMKSGFADMLSELYSSIHADLTMLGKSYAECAGMGTTLSLCWFAPGWMYFAHIGDSRIYYFPRDGGMTQLTHDDTHVGWLRRQGRINEREARMHPARSGLSKALGAGHQFVEPQTGAVGIEPGDRFLLCTDGLIEGLWDRRIHELVREPTPGQSAIAPARRLIEASMAESGRDNLTAIVVEVLEEPEES